MRDQDWEGLMKAMSIHVQAIHFSNGTSQGEQNAITDHMIGVASFIEKYRQPQYVQAISDVNIRLRKDLEEKELQNGELAAKCATWADRWNETDNKRLDAQLQNDRYRKALQDIASWPRPITDDEPSVDTLIDKAKVALIERRNDDPRKGCRDFAHLGQSVSAQDGQGEWTLTKCSNCGQVV